MSVTRPTLIGFLLRELGLELEEPELPQLETSDDEPQPDTTAARARHSAANRMVMRLGTTESLQSRRGENEPGASLRSRAVSQWFDTSEQRLFDRKLRETGLDRGPCDVAQRGVVEAEMAGCEVVLAADAGAEVRRVVGGERDPHPGVSQRTERVVVVARVHAGGHVGARAGLEHDAALGDLRDQRGVLDRAH